jgi:hypothetical protein
VTIAGAFVTRFGPEAALIDVRVMALFGAAAYLAVARRLSPAVLRPAAQT